MIATGVPVGLGSYVQWDRKLDGRLAQALMSIPAIKAVGIGLGPEAAVAAGLARPRRDRARRDRAHASPASARPTNNAGGLEGGVTNGEDLRVSAWMKPISTLMKPLRSVDLTTMAEAPAAIERSDVCAVPAAAVVGEAMVALVLADALLERFGGDSIAATRARAGGGGRRARFARAFPAARNDSADPPLRRRAAARTRRRRRRTFDDELQRLIDDMIETMYAAPGIGLAATQVGVPLRVFVVDLSVGRDPRRADRDGQPGVRRSATACSSRKKAASACPGSTPPSSGRRARSSRGSTAHGDEQTVEGDDLLARAFQHEMDHLDGIVFVDRLRGIKRDLIVRKIQKLKTSRQMVSHVAACGSSFFGTPEFAVPSLEALIGVAPSRRRASCRSRTGRAAAGSSCSRRRRRSSRSQHGIPVLQPARIRDEAFLQQLAALRRRTSASSRRTAASCPTRCSRFRGSGMINVHASLLPRYRGAAPVHRAVHRRRRGDRRHDHAGGDGARRRADVRASCAGRSARTRRAARSSATSRDAGRATCCSTSSTHWPPAVRRKRRRTTRGRPTRRRSPRTKGAIDWTLPAAGIHNRVRGLQPWPLVSARLDGDACPAAPRPQLTDEIVATARAGHDRSRRRRTSSSLPAGDRRALRILEIQPEGRRAMTAREFLAGRRIVTGSRARRRA